MWSALSELVSPPDAVAAVVTNKTLDVCMSSTENNTKPNITISTDLETHITTTNTDTTTMDTTVTNTTNTTNTTTSDVAVDDVDRAEPKSPVKEMENQEDNNSKSNENSVTWEEFSRQRLHTAFFYGNVLLPEFINPQKSTSSVSSHGSKAQNVVDLDLWNRYWCAFSDSLASYIEDLQEYLGKDEIFGKKRCVLVAAPLTLESHNELFQDKLVASARSFGALECVSRKRSIVMLQFTFTRSAEIFASWASTLTLDELFPDDSLSEEGNMQNRKRKSKLVVRLALQENHKLTSTLQVGRNVVLSTPFVEGLFKGIFDAESVTYQTGSFLIRFASVQAAKIALHTLQRSFVEVFGLELSFYDESQLHDARMSLLGEKRGR
ncbi:hypothetical protein LSM04_004287 [Trypanosoma melophagium]|uniref:uncharacterized protein n=1 Tax=Trypanosoma melophagium TaxID=715481 RepID=UPI00351AA1C4|nr:hypothetical protein LSM04_004287 [Trypanosoma melophagium]